MLAAFPRRETNELCCAAANTVKNGNTGRAEPRASDKLAGQRAFCHSSYRRRKQSGLAMKPRERENSHDRNSL
jgi:hypothetical protein